MSALYLVETVVLLLIVVLAIVTLAYRVLIPYPILLVLGGLVLSLLPAAPVVPLNPDIVFVIFLPPILWAAAYFTSLRDFVANIRPISMLAFGLVLATSVAVAAVARHVIPGLSWPVALALGAIVSPPDAVAATAIARRLRLPHRLVTILEGESLINDATALVLYRAAVAAAVGGAFTYKQMAGQFVLSAVGGIAIGLVVGMVTRWALKLTTDGLTATAITLLTPYAAWIVAERGHVSAVLACVAGGLYVRQSFSEVVSPATRVQARAVWDLLVFVLNGVIFILIGLQLSAIRSGLAAAVPTLLLHGAVISATAIAVRLLWVVLLAVLTRLINSSAKRRDPPQPWRHLFVVGWAGMRGIVSLAAALALPLATAAGEPFPHRDEIIVLAFAVILSTLVIQGLTLSPLIRALRLEEDATLELEEAQARETAARAALERLDQVAAAPWARREQVERMRALYAQRLAHSSPLLQSGDRSAAQAQAGYRRLRHATLDAERQAVVALRDQGIISDEVLHRIEQELDVEAMQTGLGEVRMGSRSLPMG
jgi:CPA1 family monovalent cation:H+ antiporter